MDFNRIPDKPSKMELTKILPGPDATEYEMGYRSSSCYKGSEKGSVAM
jgi:hypothetical protein